MKKPQDKFTKSTIIVYIIVLVIGVVIAVFLGGAMNLSINNDGTVDISVLGDNFIRVTEDMTLLFKKNNNNYIGKMILLVVMCISIHAIYYSTTVSRTHRKGEEHGSAKWGDAKEMKSLADKKNEITLLPMKDKDGKQRYDDDGEFVTAVVDNNIILSKEVLLSLNPIQNRLNFNVLILGGSGAGKTRFYAIPNLLQMNTSYVVTDPKGEILQKTGNVLKQAGYKVRVFNLIQMQHSNNYNPFHYVYDINGELSEDNIKKMVNVLCKNTKGDGDKDDFWSQKGQTLLEAIVYLLFEESEYNAKFDSHGKIIPETRDLSNLNFFAVTEKMRRLQYPPRGSQQPDGYMLEKNYDETDEEFEIRRSKAFLCPLDKDFIELEKRKGDTLAGRLYKEVRNAPEETGQSFLSSANVRTFFFNMNNLKNLTCCDDIHLETLGDEKTALFIIIPATDRTYNFLAAMMYTQMFDVLSNRANFKYGGTLPVHVRCIMDEFANIGKIPDFENVISFVRSMGMSLNIIIQNLAQLKSQYEKTWEIITGNCDTMLFLGGKEESTLKSLSESLGKETIDVKGFNRTKGRQSSTSENNSIMGRALMEQNEIKVMPVTDCILEINHHNPFYCKKFSYTDHVNSKFIENNEFNVSTIHSITYEEFKEQFKNNTSETQMIVERKDEDTNIQGVNEDENTNEVFTNKSDNSEEIVLQTEKISNYEEKLEKTFPIDDDEVDININFESVDIDDYEIVDGSYEPEEYVETSFFGEPSSLEAFDLGEPVQKNVDNIISAETNSNEVFYGDNTNKEELDISVEDVSESYSQFKECYTFSDELQSADMFTFDNM